MKTKLRNITITLEEELARWARVEAAREDTSVSSYLAGVLRQRMKEEGEYEAAKKRAVKRKHSGDQTESIYRAREAHEAGSRVR